MKSKINKAKDPGYLKGFSNNSCIRIVCFIVASILSVNSYAVTDAMKIKIAGNNYSDETIIRFTPMATDTFDGCCDSWKLFSNNASVPNLFTKITNGSALAINALPVLDKQRVVDVYIKIGVAGVYVITPYEVGAFSQGVCIMMKDNATGQYYDLRMLNSYSINFPVIAQTDPARFTVFFSLPAEVLPTDVSCSACSDGKVIINKTGCSNWQYCLQDSIGNPILTGIAVASATITGLAMNKYKLVINTPFMCSETLGFTINSLMPTGVLNNNSADNLNFFSDGSNFFLEANSFSPENVIVEMYNMAGVMVYGTKFMQINERKNLGITHLPSGLYAAKATDRDIVVTKKLVKIF